MLPIAQIPSEGAGPSAHPNRRVCKPMPEGQVLHGIIPHGDQRKSPSKLQILQ